MTFSGSFDQDALYDNPPEKGVPPATYKVIKIDDNKVQFT